MSGAYAPLAVVNDAQKRAYMLADNKLDEISLRVRSLFTPSDLEV